MYNVYSWVYFTHKNTRCSTERERDLQQYCMLLKIKLFHFLPNLEVDTFFSVPKRHLKIPNMHVIVRSVLNNVFSANELLPCKEEEEVPQRDQEQVKPWETEKKLLLETYSNEDRDSQAERKPPEGVEWHQLHQSTTSAVRLYAPVTARNLAEQEWVYICTPHVWGSVKSTFVHTTVSGLSVYLQCE